MFAAAIQGEEQKIVVDTNEILVEASYKGPSLKSIDDVTPDWIK
jgi:hypothetical protein